MKYIAFPIGIAPTGSHKMAHPDGELATARGLNLCMFMLVNMCFVWMYCGLCI